MEDCIVMKNEQVLKEQLIALLTGQNAHANFDRAVENFPIGLINNRIPNYDHTPWQMIEHLRLTQWDILEFIRNPKHVSPPWPEGYWPKKSQANEVLWKNSIKQFRNDLNDIIGIIKNKDTDFFAPISHAKQYTIFREIVLAADHNAYHIGQLIMMRKILGKWPPR